MEAFRKFYLLSFVFVLVKDAIIYLLQLFIKSKAVRKRSLFIKHVLLLLTLCEKCPNTQFFLVRILPYSDWIRRFTGYGKIRIRGNTDQKKLRIWTLFAQCELTREIVGRLKSISSTIIVDRNFSCYSVYYWDSYNRHIYTYILCI